MTLLWAVREERKYKYKNENHESQEELRSHNMTQWGKLQEEKELYEYLSSSQYLNKVSEDNLIK